ncbi:MAG: ComEA family DNA-binding protein [Oscillospiraceae bacterium]|jgi:competence protein ComEA|nr:ComEA family DNA-binding protein [Oscillospiraceae bacterium]
MRVRKAELSVIIITVAFVCFAGGFFVGRMGAPGGITPVPAPDAPPSESADALPPAQQTPTDGGASPALSPTPTPEPSPELSDTEHDAQGRVNINTASAGTLQELRGIGPALSARIIEYREQNGAFTAIDQLLEVTGIGNAKLADIRDHVTVG